MSTMVRSVAAVCGVALAVFALALALTPGATHGATVGNVDIVAIDTNTTGNTASSIGTVQGCRDTLSVSDTFDIDVFVRGVNTADGISGVSFDLIYDPAILEVTARDDGTNIMFFQATPKGSYFDNGDALPSTGGDYRHDAAEIGGTGESGDGILARLTLQVVGSGVSTLVLNDSYENDGTPNVLDFANAGSVVLNPLQLGGAEIRSNGTTCPVPTASPTPGPTASPAPTNAPTQTPMPTGIPLTATPAPTAKPLCNTTLTASVAVGAATIDVASATGCAAGDTIRIGSGASQEDVKISSVSGTTITLLAGVKKAHASGETVVEVAAATGSPVTTAKTGPATGDGSGSAGMGSTLLILAAIFGVILSLTAGGSLLLARTERKE